MLILGILAAIAIPAFLNQKGKANDASAKVQVRTMQTAMETCASDNTGAASYTGCNMTRLNSIEPTIPASGPTVTLTGGGDGYIATSAQVGSTNNYFQVTKLNTGVVTHNCGSTATGANPVLTVSGTGGCPPGGNW
jgi:type IV pilus assembly protein PilA